MFGNKLLAPWSPFEPFVNVSTPSNLGSFELVAGTASATVNIDQLDASSRVLVEQRTGVASSFVASADAGYLRMEFDPPLLESAAFRYEFATCSEELAPVMAQELGC